MECREKHTNYQPSNKEFRCPKCGAWAGYFYIDESAGEGDCDLLHTRDVILCDDCGYRTTGSRFASALRKKYNMVKCPHCLGKGFVRSGKGKGK